MKLAFADLYRYVSDPRTMDVTPQQMLTDAYLESRAKLIRLDRATQFEAGRPHAGGTIYLSAADENGMMISFIQSNRSEEHTSELQSLMRISYAVFCLKKKKQTTQQ